MVDHRGDHRGGLGEKLKRILNRCLVELGKLKDDKVRSDTLKGSLFAIGCPIFQDHVLDILTSQGPRLFLCSYSGKPVNGQAYFTEEQKMKEMSDSRPNLSCYKFPWV